MIAKDGDSAENSEDFDDLSEVSKSQLKRDALAVRRLTEILGGMSAEQRGAVPLPDPIRIALAELDRTGSRGARKRQIGFVTKLLRKTELGPIEAAVEAEQLRARAHTLAHHRVEQWRDQLLGLADDSPNDALTALVNEFPEIDRQLVSQLQRNALTERARNPDAPSKSARQLFRVVRDAIADSEPY
ncbi:MAG: DUF615 domain-containing protein [Gammaproteobacteria bacterium]|nr:DUF615 domain-containing protein [Gammaproteobacteria bacterium]